MDFDATQVIEERPTTTSNGEDGKPRTGTLRIGNAEYEIVRGFNRIGRSPLCRVVLDDPTVSKVHAEIQAGLEATFICDLKSANGTTFKGLPLKPFFFYPINDGDAVFFGRVKAVYEIVKPAQQKIDVTPKKPVETRTYDGERQSTSSSFEDDRLFDDADESMVPGTARKEKKRLFRLPGIPGDCQKNKLKLTRSIGESEPIKETNENHKKTDSINIHEMETQNISDLASVHDTEAPKRPQLDNSKPMLNDFIEKSIYDAETQVSIVTDDRIVKPTNQILHDDDSITNEEHVTEKNLKSSKSQVIAETDDESGTDDEVANVVRSRITNDISDDSITDDENEFASIATTIARKKEQQASSRKTQQPAAEERRNSREIANETDMDLLPTQILDVATSTPMLRPSKGQIDDSHEQKIDEDDDDLFGAPTQVLFEVPVDTAGSSSKISHVDDTVERKLDTDIQDLQDAPTQIIDIPAGKAESRAKISQLDNSDRRKLETNCQDLHDAPTQAFVIPVGKADSIAKILRRNYSRKSQLETNDQDLHDAPTQSSDVLVGKADSKAKIVRHNYSRKPEPQTTDRDLHDEPTQILDIPVSEADSSSKMLHLTESGIPEVETKDQDLHDAPTQAFDIPVDKPNSKSKIFCLNRSGKRKFETNNQDLHDAPTQIFDVSVGNADSGSKIPRLDDVGQRKLETNNQGIYDEPTQAFDMPTGKADSRLKILRRNDSRKSEPKNDNQDLDDAPTQLFDVSVGKADSSSTIGETLKSEEKKKNENGKVNLDDTITRNLGQIFGDEANNEDDLMDEPTQLMTQNLVDILRPTQALGSSPTREARKSPRSSIDGISRNETIDDVQISPSTRKRKTNSAGTLGFVDGQAVRSREELLSAPSFPKKHGAGDEIEDAPGREIESSASGHQPITGCNEEDDILFGLPEVKLYGTLSNPGSPTPSSTSSHNDLVLPKTGRTDNKTEKNVSARIVKKAQRRAAESRWSIDDRVEKFESNESKSLIQPIKLSRGKKKIRKRIIDNDDDEEHDSDVPFEYNDLKTMADELLASDVTGDTRVKSNDKNFATRSSRIKKNIETKKATAKSQRTRKLSKKSLSLIVTDTNSELSDDGGENKNLRSTRLGKISDVTMKKNISQAVEQESSTAEVKNEIVVPVKKKTYATVKLTRLTENDVQTKNLDTPKATRLRRLTSVPKELTISPTTKTRSRGRRTIGDVAESRGSHMDQRHKILFTGIKDEDYEKIVTKLGGSVVSDPSKATVLISDKIRRTFKFLCSMARGIKIVSITWLTESNKAGQFLDCDSFMLEDSATEAKFNFKLAKSLKIAQEKKLLDGYTIFVTPKVNQPEIDELKGMIEACGARVQVRPPRAWDSKTVIISREDDLAAAKTLLSKAPKSMKITVQSTEFILTGILQQEINLLEHKLI